METVAPRVSASFNTGCKSSKTTKSNRFFEYCHARCICSSDVLTVLCKNDQNLESTFNEDFMSAVALHCLKDGLVQGTVYHSLLEILCVKSIILIHL
jgi:hypothetical protein